MNEKDILGKHFEFVKDFFQNPTTFGVVDLYQIGDVCCECGFEIPTHHQICHEISYIVTGAGKFYLNGIAYPVKAGDIFICSQGQEHRITTIPGSMLRFVYIGFLFNDNIKKHNNWIPLKKYFQSPGIPIAEDKVNLDLPLMRLIDEFYGKPLLYKEMIISYINQILLLTFRSFKDQISPIYHPELSENMVGYPVYSVIIYIEKHILELENIRTISDDLGYSYSYLSHLFKNKTGITLQKYITYKKIEKSLELLKYSGLSITQVAHRLNYETLQAFSKAFHRVMGFSPSDYIHNKRSDQWPILQLDQSKQSDN